MSGGLQVAVRKEREAGGSRFVLDATLEIPAGFTVLFGPSGSGKSTLLDCIAGLLAPDAGRITIDTDCVFDAAAKVLVPPQKRRIGYVFQSLALFPHVSVAQNVEYGLAHVQRGEREARMREALKRFRLEPLARQMPTAISGGEKQRVALARSLVTQPRALLLDEPLSGLDAQLRNAIVEDLRAWNAARPIPVVYVTHSREEAEALGEQVAVIEDGKIVRQGPPAEVLNAPRRQRLAQIAGFENLLDATVQAVHEKDGTMRVQLAPSAREIEVPMAEAAIGEAVHVAIRAGDILLAVEPPQKLSARNVLAGKISSLQERSGLCVARVDCGAEFIVHVTRGAVRDLDLSADKPVWVVLKTHSCHLVRR